MPWIDKVAGVLEVWYAGSKGADATAAILFGDVNPSAKLPLTFPKSDADLPHPKLATPPRVNGQDTFSDPSKAKPLFTVTYDEGLKVGYKWYDAEDKAVLFPFGFGLSYTTFAYSDLKVTPGPTTTVSFTVRNTGQRDGAEVSQVYAGLPASAAEPPKRLVGFSKTQLKAGESKQVTFTVDPKYLSVYDEAQKGWKIVPGDYTFSAGGSSATLPLRQTVRMQ
jgi:beta-glucosidase